MDTLKLKCPVCDAGLELNNKTLRCINNHCFDISAEGYVNLLTRKNKNGDLLGDNKSMARARQSFLKKDYYVSLANFLSSYVKDNDINYVIDICCGEGYYGRKILADNEVNFYGFDLSKEMIRLAAKSKMKATLFVANLAYIPVISDGFDLALNMFAPFNENEFSRVLKTNGKLLYVVPGENHLMGLKKAIYDTPYKNILKFPECDSLKLNNTYLVKDNITLNSYYDIMELFMMTPYYYHTSDIDKNKLKNFDTLNTELEFVVVEYIKK